jgi:hypothetical protein
MSAYRKPGTMPPYYSAGFPGAFLLAQNLVAGAAGPGWARVGLRGYLTMKPETSYGCALQI